MEDFEQVLKKREDKLMFYKREHRYTVDFKEYTPVTKYIESKKKANKEFFYQQKFKITGSDFELIKGTKEVKDVFDSWNETLKEAQKTGINKHNIIEKGIRSYKPYTKTKDKVLSLIYDYLDKQKFDKFFVERKIYTEVEIAGIFDFLGFRGEEIVLIDWKTCKKLWYTSKLKMHEPFSALDDCNYNHYAIQLCLYKYILEKEYKLKNIVMKIVIVKDDELEELIIPQEFYDQNKAFKY